MTLSKVGETGLRSFAHGIPGSTPGDAEGQKDVFGVDIDSFFL